MEETEPKRDHLFINYATEDAAFAEWLTLRLTAEGYKVWCDRTQLLGGESYPLDIDLAIKTQTFRFLALLSRSSLGKPNPRKERTLALNIARQRGEDFIIPLNVDGLRATELDWMTSDLTFIPFDKNWATGFVHLLKKLGAVDTPKDVCTGRSSVCDWIAVQAEPVTRSEKLRANLLPVLEIPRVLHKFEITERVILPKLGEHWPFYSLTASNIVWAFDPPSADLNVPVQRLTSLSWRDFEEYDGILIQNIALAILRKAITVKCLQRGMKLVPKTGFPYYPEGLLEANHLRFTTYDGKRSYVSAIGERTFRRGDQIEKVRYHLSPSFYLTSTDCAEMAVRVAVRLHLTDLQGYPLEGSKVTSRRKRICKNWWNHEWISRFLAVVEWLCDGHAESEVLLTANGCLRIGATPFTFSADQGIDESNLQLEVAIEDDEPEIDEDIEVAGDDFEEYEEDAEDE
jgi:hypothetical protein